jgi:hypothetical protein
LPSGALQCVLSLEGDEYFAPSEIASNADTYTRYFNDKGIYRGNTISNIQLGAGNNDTRKASVSSYYNRPNTFHSIVTGQLPVMWLLGFKNLKRLENLAGVCSESHILSQFPDKSKTGTNETVKENESLHSAIIDHADRE